MEKAISSDLIRGHIDTIILHSLLDGDKFAQQISEAIEQKSNGEYIINQATLYSSLKRLENLKYVNAYWNDGANGRRRFFKLTELGKTIVEQNLSNWSYSRSIIDKLMDLSPEPIYKTQVVEKIVYASQNEAVSPVQQGQSVSDKVVENAPQQLQMQIETKKTPIIEEKPEQEINFRNILNGLIKETKTKEVVENKSENIDRKVQEKPEEKLKLNETITTSNYNALKPSNNNGNIDYGDMVLQAEKEGYKLTFSSKQTKRSKGSVYLNKINLFASLITFIFVLVEYLLVMMFGKTILSPSILAVVLSILGLAVFPIFTVVAYCVNPSKTTKNVKKDSILTALIVVFNLLLITLAVDLIVGIDFGDMFYLLLSVIVPVLILIDVLVYYISRYLLSKNKGFTVEK